MLKLAHMGMWGVGCANDRGHTVNLELSASDIACPQENGQFKIRGVTPAASVEYGYGRRVGCGMWKRQRRTPEGGPASARCPDVWVVPRLRDEAPPQRRAGMPRAGARPRGLQAGRLQYCGNARAIPWNTGGSHKRLYSKRLPRLTDVTPVLRRLRPAGILPVDDRIAVSGCP